MAPKTTRPPPSGGPSGRVGLRGAPVFDENFCMATLGHVFVVRVQMADDRAFDRYLAELARAVDTRPDDARVTVFYDIPNLAEISAAQRSRLAGVLNPRREKIAKTSTGLVLATPSPVVRGLLQAVFWLAPPPYAYTFVKTARDAIRKIAELDETMDPEAFEAEYRELLERWQRER